LALVLFAAATDAAASNVAVRRPDVNELGTNNYEADFTRAYEECTAPTWS
jgi:hypothetical protein